MFIVRISMLLLLAPISARLGLSECRNQTTMLPLRGMKAASKSRDFVRFKYPLSSGDSLLIRSHEDSETSIGPYDLGFTITRNGVAIQNLALRTLPEFRDQDSFFSEAFATIAVTRVCGAHGAMYFVTMHYMGDQLSPALVFVIVPSAKAYEVITLPMFSGGTVDVSTSHPRRLRIWDNLNEGMCNACETAYRITEWELRGGKAIRTRQYRTRHLYSSVQFEDDESRIRFVP
jgi:hypothetical protein